MLPRMDDPNGELRRQRDLVAAHLRWLDEQIARAPGTAPAPLPAPPTPPAMPASPPHLVATETPKSSATHVAASTTSASLPEIALPEIDPGSIRNEVRRGCFVYVAIVTLLLALSIAAAVWIGGQ